MQIFLDSADVDAIRRAADTGLLDGVTTNPTHIAKSGKPFIEVVKEICSIVSGPVSVEAVAETAEGLVQQAEQIASLAPNIVVKIPMTVEGLKAVPLLEEQKKIRTNVTMIFSSTQCHLAMKSGASYVSIVLSRLDAVGNESDILISDAVQTRQNYGFSSQIIAGSVKTQNHILSALRAGVDIATVPEALFFQMFRHPLTDEGLAAFDRDWKRVVR